MYIDELPIWGMLGEYMMAEVPGAKVGESSVQEQGFLYTHKEFSISYHGRQIIEVNLTSENPRPIVAGTVGALTFSVTWIETNKPFESRFDRYLDFDFFEHQVSRPSPRRSSRSLRVPNDVRRSLSGYCCCLLVAALDSLVLHLQLRQCIHAGSVGVSPVSLLFLFADFPCFFFLCCVYHVVCQFMMVVFLCGLVALILMRTLKNDYARYTSEGGGDLLEMDLDRVVDESGWKQVHGDVFRAPQYLLLYSSLIGTGCQLMFLGLCVITLTLFASMYDERGSAMTAFLVCYSLTSLVAGYAGANFYKQNHGTEWKKCMLATAVLYPGVCFVIAFLLNFIAVYYQSLASFSFQTMFLMLLIWLCVSCPLVLVGTILGRSTATAGDFPCRVNALRRPIPQDAKWFTQPLALALFAGILPFGSIFIEIYFVFTSFWNYRFYYVRAQAQTHSAAQQSTRLRLRAHLSSAIAYFVFVAFVVCFCCRCLQVYGFMFLVFLILLIVTVCVTIVSTYVLLNAEDYRWHWSALLSGGSTALYVYLYAIYYFFTKTHMSGVMQTAFYFGYMAMFCIGLFVLTGTVGFIGANIFIRRIYQYIKSD